VRADDGTKKKKKRDDEITLFRGNNNQIKNKRTKHQMLRNNT